MLQILVWMIYGIFNGHCFTSELQKAHIHLFDLEDELIWSYKKVGNHYSTKLGYLATRYGCKS
jgi:hypothetical protein